jgi:hypothetical protein
MSEEHTGEKSTEDGSGISRRRLVASGAATWATVSVAGCSRIDDPNQPIFGEAPTATETATPANTNETDGTTVTNETTTTEDPGSGGGGPTPTETACASIRQFAPGMEIGLHVSVYETETGEPLGDGDLEGVKLEFPEADLDTQELTWSGNHEDHDANSWGGKIETSEDIESGTYQYEVVVEGDDADVAHNRITDQFTIV